MRDTPQRQDFEIEQALLEWLDDPECLQRLCQRWPTDEVGRLAADMYFALQAWQPRYSRYDQRTRVILTVLRAGWSRLQMAYLTVGDDEARGLMRQVTE